MVRFGIIGFGLHAVKRLMPGFALSKKCQVTALSRRKLADARESADQYQIPYAFDSAAELCRSSRVDAVLVTTPNSCHLPDVLIALDQGKPVLCEKPMALSAEQCRQMVEAARERQLLLGVAQVFRFTESLRKIRALVAGGEIGPPVFARSEFSFLASATHPRKWLHDAAIAGAGPIFDIGVHAIDSLRFILEDEVARVYASALSDPNSGDVESAAALTLEFAQGTIGTVLVSFRAEYRTPLELVGHDAVLRADDALNVEHPIEIQLRRNGAVAETHTASNHLAYALQVDAFADAIEGKSKFPAPGEEGWQNQEILDAALRSIRSGQAERVRRVAI
jgi:1,5-anhydro-D-fructose reductase (1,5-anhydro-D-mannitol-forming)